MNFIAVHYSRVCCGTRVKPLQHEQILLEMIDNTRGSEYFWAPYRNNVSKAMCVYTTTKYNSILNTARERIINTYVLSKTVLRITYDCRSLIQTYLLYTI